MELPPGDGTLAGRGEAGVEALAPLQEAYAAAFWQALRAARRRERAAALTLAGPHRDDLQFLVAGRDMRLFGSRGQQRTVALAVKMAEVAVMQAQTGQRPILLLDDVMSELDATRRQYLLRLLDGSSQALVTTTDWEDFSPAFRAQVHCLQVARGQITPVAE